METSKEKTECISNISIAAKFGFAAQQYFVAAILFRARHVYFMAEKKKTTTARQDEKTEADEVPYWDLRTACFKLRSIGHLLSRQADDGSTELDEPEIWYGLGLIIKEIHDEVIEIARLIEEEQISRAQKKRRNAF